MGCDEELMTAVAAGDEAALAVLVERWQHRLAAFLWRRTDGRDAEDLYQETWLQIVRGARGFDPSRRFSTWMFQIAINVARDWFARRPSEPVDPVDVEAALETAADPVLADQRPEAAIDVESLLGTLSVEHREVVELRCLQDLSEEETSDILAIARGTVKSRLHHALRKLGEVAAASRAED
ncbi:MAG: RNA polymerase sigma-70 factor (ECF subfamily) [Hyphomicrobiaceae bacterium]